MLFMYNPHQSVRSNYSIFDWISRIWDLIGPKIVCVAKLVAVLRKATRLAFSKKILHFRCILNPWKINEMRVVFQNMWWILKWIIEFWCMKSISYPIIWSKLSKIRPDISTAFDFFWQKDGYFHMLLDSIAEWELDSASTRPRWLRRALAP